MVYINKTQDMEKIKDQFWNGQVNNIAGDLSSWSKNNNYDFLKCFNDGLTDILRCVAHGTIISNRTYTLYKIFKYAEKIIINPNIDIYETEYLRGSLRYSGCYPSNIEQLPRSELLKFYHLHIIRQFDKLISSIISFASKLAPQDKYCMRIIEEASSSPIRNFRLYSCCKISDATSFLNDPDLRVQKVAQIRTTFADKLCQYSSNEQEVIAYLTKELENGRIIPCDGLIPYDQEDLVCAHFTSDLFEESNYIGYFDDDVLSNIADKRILAEAIYKLILTRKISLNEELVPSPIVETVISNMTRS